MQDMNDIGPRVVDLKGTKSQLPVKVRVSVSAQMSVIPTSASGFFFFIIIFFFTFNEKTTYIS